MKQPTTLHYAGIDWATRSHAVCVIDHAGHVRFQVPNTGKTFTGLSWAYWAPKSSTRTVSCAASPR